MSEKRPNYQPGKNVWRPLDVGEWQKKLDWETGGPTDTPQDLAAVRAKEAQMLEMRRKNEEMQAWLARPPISAADKAIAMRAIQWQPQARNAKNLLAMMEHMEGRLPAIAQEGAGIRAVLEKTLAALESRFEAGEKIKDLLEALQAAKTRAMKAHGELERRAMNESKPTDWHKVGRYDDDCPPPASEGIVVVGPSKPGPMSHKIMPVIDNGRDSRQLSVVGRQQTGEDRRAEMTEEQHAQALFEAARAASNERLAEKWIKGGLPKDEGGEVVQVNAPGVLVIELQKTGEEVYG